MATRRCSICGEPYNRRNLLELWDVANPGHRAGWHKAEIKICTHCLSTKLVGTVMARTQILAQNYHNHILAQTKREEPKPIEPPKARKKA